MTTPLTIDSGPREDGSYVVVADGEIDMSNVASFTTAIETAVRASDGGTGVKVDLSSVDYLDSGAINTLFAHADHIRVVANPILLPVLTVSGLTDLVTVEAAPSG